MKILHLPLKKELYEMIDKKTSKQIDNIVSDIRLAIYKSALNITDGIQREIEERLVQSIQSRWEYIDKQKQNDTNR